MRYWVVADGDHRDQWDEFYRNGVVRITGRKRLGDLRKYRSQDAVQLALKKKDSEGEYENTSPRAKARLLYNFANEVEIGDGVFVRHGLVTLSGFGIVQRPPKQFRNSKPTGAYFFEKGHRFPHALKVSWAKRVSSPIGFQLAQDSSS
jgi:predicted Mrr-cat superfamily restriction endonuclease